MRNLVLGAIGLSILGGAAWAQPLQDAPVPAAVSLIMDHGAAKFVDDNGLSLYTSDRDSAGNSACVDTCTLNWPPLAAPAGAHRLGDWTPIRRPDGSAQWAYKGKPVYRFRGDTSAGQTNGAGLGGVWRVLTP